MAVRYVKTITIKGVEFCESDQSTELPELSWLRFGVTLNVAIVVTLVLSFFVVRGMFINYASTTRILRVVMPLIGILMYVGMFIAAFRDKKRRIADRPKRPSEAPDSAVFVRSAGTRGWLYEQDGMLIFESELVRYELSKGCLEKPDRLFSIWASGNGAKLLLPEGMPTQLLTCKAIESWDKEKKLTGPRKLKLLLDSWNQQSQPSRAPLYPPIRSGLPETPLGKEIGLWIFRTLGVVLPSLFAFFLFWLLLPAELGDYKQKLSSMIGPLSVLLVTYVGLIGGAKTFDSFNRTRRWNLAQKAIDAFGATKGERTVS